MTRTLALPIALRSLTGRLGAPRDLTGAPDLRCLTEEHCRLDSDCPAATRCNTALEHPLCAQLDCAANGSPCVSSVVCASGICGQGNRCRDDATLDVAPFTRCDVVDIERPCQGGTTCRQFGSSVPFCAFGPHEGTLACDPAPDGAATVEAPLADHVVCVLDCTRRACPSGFTCETVATDTVGGGIVRDCLPEPL